MMFGRFTERAQKVLALAQEEALRLGHNNIGTEHILLGLVREGEGIAAKALQALGLGSDKIQKEVESLIGRGQEMSQTIHYTPRAKKVIELSMDEARKLGHSYVGTEHILLGLIREGEGVAARVLNNLGVSLNKARQQVLQLLGSNETGSSAAGTNSNANTPTLDSLARDLTAIAKEDSLDPVIGRSKEIQRVIEVLSRRTKNNPVLIGEPGVGKTAIAEGLAQQIINNEVPEILRDKRVMTLDMGTVVAGTKYRGEFEDRLKKVMDEIRQAGNIILFIDELHTLIGAGGAEGAIDASNILKPSLARGELQCIGATTLDEYRKYIEKDAALERRFQPIQVDQPSVDESIQILQGLRDRYEAHHRVSITDDAIEAAVKLSDRYISDRFLPDKAIDLIDEAGSKVRLRSFTTPPNLKELEQKLDEVRKEKDAAVQSQEFEKAASLRDTEQRLREQVEDTKKSWKEKQGQENSEVTVDDIAMVVSSWTGVPVSKIAQTETDKLLNMENILHSRVIGQDEAVVAVAKAVRRARAGLKDPKRPIGSFIFLGPTGVGKTELARALAESIFGDEESMIRIDMSEYMEKHSTSRLVGSPPGYVGYDEGGQLTEKVRRKPYSVVLLDEIEKAHPDVFNILLQVLEDGRLTDSKGRTVDFRNTILIMTSNVGASELKRNKYVGFNVQDETQNHKDMKDKVMGELKRAFRPEFINRIDEIIVFHSLEKKHLTEIVSLMSDQLTKRLKEQDLSIELTDAAKAKVAEEGVDLEYGARPLRRAIQKHVEDRLSEELLRGNIHKGQHIVLDVEDGEFVVKTTAKTN
ncbi:ATP-dependent protease ATP-binding subunit ClpC [Bacillus subtilis]|jgi:ATP-dependent Clp protease ATP-binding subunit ClpC|uniref:ATP-dependent Clp protease ATP-binding subunit ClpC / Negative regulator of tic competence clcC/mecB n=5 Tax=Bacillus TaxID=1386 RepID=A0A0G2YVK2_BACIU|nr:MULTISPECIES: ATP-dependent protease ATP-binding subunit ClpC [Bacillus]AXC51424.1 ATP-dependent Clp protease ATP-binding subunit ClpC [Bacillus spizizenii]MDP4101662.1 ATP-dependent protease ATP-binding subunit ClpC [Bacillota bacterium]MUG03350.1 ATP-dependent Clp protease ATP-binding subunit [Bacillus tequilensis]POO76700.1 ATP-dependent Clp protease ATP-binding subunit ClpC [Bacillus sp. MBGLi97]CJS14180.1 ATP-dependent Clp protease%2C ATP-binding subunit [Streptococcus pneumoniae]